MGNNNRPHSIKYFVLVIIVFNACFVFCQDRYSEFSLTGRGDLELVGDSYKLQKETYNAFIKMQQGALRDHISIQIVSSYRSYNHQKNIWNRKFNKFVSEGLSHNEAINKIIQYTTIPGTSRHHWGTDIDIIDGSVKPVRNMLVEDNYLNDGIYSKLKQWMDLNSEKFGFYLVYNNDVKRKGFKYEPWHYSYKVLSKKMLNDYTLIDLSVFYKTKKLKGRQYLTSEFLEKYKKEHIFDIDLELK